ncbi:MAG: GNAT family N-acetyltransferase [Pseudomonadota bacterium]
MNGAGPVLEAFVASRDLDDLIGWFPDSAALLRWGGAGYAFPVRKTEFLNRLNVPEQPAYVLRQNAINLAFGQYYLRQRRLHFARLIVRPGERGRGLGERLIDGLGRAAVRRVGARPQSLFVLADNVPAIALYKRLGFVRSAVSQPFGHGLDVVFMVRPQAALDAV